MSNGTTFDSTKRPLQEVLREIHEGATQLPDFQRGWVWDDDRIRSLLASISMAFPIGALMTLSTGGVKFKPRPVEGTEPSLSTIAPDILILDGQQRLTSLYQALMGRGPVHTKDAKGKKIKRWYYVDMGAAMNPNGDREDAIRSVPGDRLVKRFGGEIGLDLSSPEKEYEQGLFPATRIFDAAPWRREFNRYWNHDSDQADLFDHFEVGVLERFKQYQVPIIKLTKETPKEAVCLVFEKVNTGGVSLTVFELVTAAFAAENFQLRDDWRARETHLKSSLPVLHGIDNDDFLQAICLMATRSRRIDAIQSGTPVDRAPGISCKRKDILKLTVEDYKAWADRAVQGFERAARFLHQQKIFRAKDIPYRKQIVPLAAILAMLGLEGETEGARRKIARWYWCGVLGELYGSAIESRFARDLPEVLDLVRGKDAEPITIHDANFAPNRLITLRTRNSAAYKGLYALLMRDGGLDFRTGEPIEGQTFFDDKIDIHHIFPRKWCEMNGIPAEDYNSIINKTAISARTNRSIGAKAPSIYLGTLERVAEIPLERMNELLRSHLIPPSSLRADDFGVFFEQRADALLGRIEDAMGKDIARDPEVFRADAERDDYEEEPEEWEEDVPALAMSV